MKTKAYLQIISHLILFILMGVFFLTGMEKVWHHKDFVIMLNRQPMPLWMLALLEWAVPALELGVVALLVMYRTRLAGLWASAALMLAFTGYTIYAASEPYGYVPCACGKLLSSLSWTQHIWVNLALTTLAGVGIWIHYRISHTNEVTGAKPGSHHHTNNMAPLPG